MSIFWKTLSEAVSGFGWKLCGRMTTTDPGA